MDYIIRAATLDDYEGVAAVYAELDKLHRDELPQLFRAPDGPALSREYFAAMAQHPQHTLLVADRNGDILGFAEVQLREAPDTPYHTPRRYAKINQLGVRSDVRGGGIGRALMDTARDWAHERGLAALELNVFAFNEGALAFYERLGYRTLLRKMVLPLE
jgi:GNAT superfamily N-acetyltransferase